MTVSLAPRLKNSISGSGKLERQLPETASSSLSLVRSTMNLLQVIGVTVFALQMILIQDTISVLEDSSGMCESTFYDCTCSGEKIID
jgi:hypothetical protein